MELSRTRQFADYRSQSSSKCSELSSLRGSQVSIASTPSEACYNCANIILADRKKRQFEKQRKQQRDFMRKSLKMANQYKDQQFEYKNNLKQQALKHNAQMIKQHKKAQKLQLEEDIKYANQIKQIVTIAQKEYTQQIEAQKQKQRQFYKQLKNQYVEELQKKDDYRLKKDRDDAVQGLPLFNPNKRQQILSYKKELLSQIQEKQQQKREHRVENQKLEKSKLKQFQIQAQKYHHDNIELGNKKNTQLLSQVKTIQIEKQKIRQNQRKRNNQQRAELIRRDNEEKSRQMKKKMAQMQSYVHDLKVQMLAKEQKMKQKMFRDSRFEQKIAKSTQQIKAQMQIKKQCKGCQKSYPIQYISKIPKK